MSKAETESESVTITVCRKENNNSVVIETLKIFVIKIVLWSTTGKLFQCTCHWQLLFGPCILVFECKLNWALKQCQTTQNDFFLCRCEVSVCYKPDSSTDWTKGRVFSSQTQPLQPTFCSLLCLPVATFSGPQPWTQKSGLNP